MYYVSLIFLVNMYELFFKRCITTVNTFQKILDNSTRKPKEIGVDRVSELYNSYLKMVKR